MVFISILRGINVSGQKKIKMEDLKSLYILLGFQDVVTYIQSGNVIFCSKLTNKKNLKCKIEAAIEKKYKFTVPVDIRTSTEIKKIISKCPFGNINLIEEGTKVLVTFFHSKPAVDNIKALQQYVKMPEKLIFGDNELYLYCPDGYGKSKLSNTFIEKKLGVDATTRNWRTVCQLNELSK